MMQRLIHFCATLVLLVIFCLPSPGQISSSEIQQNGALATGMEAGKELPQYLYPAAIKGDAEAQFKLGRMYFTGRVMPLDYWMAGRWLTRAAAQGHADAQFMLGGMYGVGFGVPYQDDVQALMWFILAANHGNQAADQGIRTIKARLTKTQVAEVAFLVSEWRPVRESTKDQ